MASFGGESVPVFCDAADDTEVLSPASPYSSGEVLPWPTLLLFYTDLLTQPIAFLPSSSVACSSSCFPVLIPAPGLTALEGVRGQEASLWEGLGLTLNFEGTGLPSA